MYDVIHALEAEGYYASTKWGVSGRGKQKGIMVGDVTYEEMSKNALMIAAEDEDKEEIVTIIMKTARSGESGNSGDGRVFIVPIEESYTISTQKKDE